MGEEPAVILELHDIMGRLQKNGNVQTSELKTCLHEAVQDKNNFGTWIKKTRDERTGQTSVSCIRITHNHLLQAFRCTAYKSPQ